MREPHRMQMLQGLDVQEVVHDPNAYQLTNCQHSISVLLCQVQPIVLPVQHGLRQEELLLFTTDIEEITANTLAAMLQTADQCW